MRKRGQPVLRKISVFEEDDPLEANSLLRRLLYHYAELGTADRESWQGRVMELDELPPRELSRLHGELIAQGWVELNAGATPACYRVTLPGLRAYRGAEQA